MSRGINKAIIIGNLGNDPDSRFTPNGSAVTNLSIATDESYKDKQSGQMVPKTEWHKVVMFNRLAEVAGEYLKKGSKVYIEGRLQTRKWQNKEGQDCYTTEIVANEMQMLDGRNDGGQQSTPQAQPSPMANNPQGYAQNQQQNNVPQQTTTAPQGDYFEDDIPFN